MQNFRVWLIYRLLLLLAPVISLVGLRTGSRNAPKRRAARIRKVAADTDLGFEDQLNVQFDTPGRPNTFADFLYDYQWVRTVSMMEWGGATYGECLVAASKIDPKLWGSWDASWEWMADRLGQSGREARDGGHLLTAKARFLRAYNYCRAAEFYVTPRDERKRQLYNKSQGYFRDAVALLDPPAEILKAPFEGREIPIYFYRAADDDKPRPTIILHGGGDASGEELYFWGGAAALERGYNVIAFEGPGQRGFLYENPDMPFRPDYETVISTVIDYSLTLPGIDTEKLALYALSLGGYTGSRAAATDRRIKAFVVNSPMTDFYKFMTHALKRALKVPFTDEQAQTLFQKLRNSSHSSRFAADQLEWIMGASSVWDALEKAKAMRLDGMERNIACPTLCIFSVSEGAEHYRQFKEFTANLQCSYDTHFFDLDTGADLHCQVNNLTAAYEVAWDWLDTTFGRVVKR